jgi:hypothetical protein
MEKKPKTENISDILDRIDDDLITLRDKFDELENHDCDSDSDEDFEDDDSDEE